MTRTGPGRRSFFEQARREQIVAAAIDVLYESGFAAASLGAIAEHIGVSKGVISYHFASKNELLREVVAQVLTEAGRYMRPRIEAAGSIALLALEMVIPVPRDAPAGRSACAPRCGAARPEQPAFPPCPT